MKERSETQYGKLPVSERRTSTGEPNALPAKVHIAFGDSFAGSLKVALNRSGCSDTHKMIVFRDRFSIGPLWQLHEEAGRACRTGWFRDRINHKDDEDDRVAQYQGIVEQMARIPAEASVVLWSGYNAHYRLRELIYSGALEIKGVPRTMRDYSVRLKRRGGPSIGPREPYFDKNPSF